MRDRLRYRAWDKENKRYIYGVEKGLQFYSTAGNLRVMTLTEIEGSDKYDLEQCTGLKDKNGKLIYEGDIVNCSFSGKTNTVETFSKKMFQGKHLVGFFEYYFSPFNYVNASDVEVIGNINENPELLEQNRKQRSVNTLSETTLYFITKENEVKKVNRSVKELYFKNPAKSIYQISLDDKWYDIDRETWEYISEWTTWH